MSDSPDLSLLRLLDASPSRSQRELARELGMSLGKTNYVLKALLARGLVKIRNFRNSDNKRAYAYLLTPKGLSYKAEMTRRFLEQRLVEYEAMRLEILRLRRETEGVAASAPAVPERGTRQ